MICPECGAENGRFAASCRRCEQPLPAGRNRRLLVISLAVAGALLLLLLIRSTPRTQQGAEPTAVNAKSRTAGRSTDPSLPYALELAPDWQVEEQALAGLASMESEPDLALTRTEGYAFGAIFTEEAGISANALAELALERLTVRAQNFQIGRRYTGTLGEKPAEFAEFSLESKGGVSIRYLAAYGSHGGYAAQVLFWAPARDFPRYRSEFEAMLAGWRWRVDGETDG